jgi:hypothetical protein
VDKLLEKQFALFDHKDRRKSQWFIKLGACLLEWERKGRRFIIKDNRGNIVDHR